MENKNIRIATSIPSLKDKIQTRIEGATDNIFWYIKFNIPLDESTVSEKTMSVTDTDGYIMRTDISYHNENNLIIITPLDTYEQNIFYLLNISKKVKSEKGQPLRSEIHILFKLYNNEISEYKVLKQNVEVPKPRSRPKDYDAMIRSKVYSFDTEGTPQGKLAAETLRVNLVFAVLSLLAVVGSFFLKNLTVTLVCVAFCLAAAGYMVYQLTRRKTLSVIYYNRGVRQFNKEKYEAASFNFRKALAYDAENEKAEYAVNKVGFYL